MKPLWLVVGLLGAVGFPLTASAAARCAPGMGGCTIENPTSRLQVQTTESVTNVVASPQVHEGTPRIAPIDTQPEGQTYGRWAAAWEQWALGIPAAVNPLLDMTGANCARRQVDEVWFLAGSALGPSPVVRSCEVPAGKSLFFPLINTVYGAFLNDPPDTRTEEFVRTAGSCTEPAQISAWIDDFKVPKPTRFFTGASGSQSPFFNVQLPPGNVFGLDEAAANELVLSPSAEQGYYLFVRPLPPGKHTIRWIASGCTPGNVQDITYNVSVVGNGGPHH